MARTKKIKQFEIDFAFPHRDRDIMFNKDGTDKYTIEQLFEYAEKSTNDYTVDFAKSVKSYKEKHGTITDSQKWSLLGMAAPFSPAFDEVDKDFFAWYDSRPDMQQLYEAVSGELWWYYDRDGKHYDRNHAENAGWLKRPNDHKMFYSVAYSGEGNKYRELNRDIIYDVGDQVVLRTPFKGSYRYDPTYGRGIPHTDERVGMVVEHKDQITRRSRGGKGSRLINVLWLQTGEQKPLPERCIKKYKAPKQ